MSRAERLAQLRNTEDALAVELDAVRASLRELVPPVAADESAYRADGRRAAPWGPEQAASRRALRMRERTLMQVREKLRVQLAELGIQRALPLLAKVYIATPCTARWEDMEGDQIVRFCAECKKHVHNISEMTAEQAEAFLASRAGMDTCVRLYRRDDGTVITSDCVPGIARAKRRRFVAVAAATTTFLAGFGATAAVSMPTMQTVEADGWAPERPTHGLSGFVHSSCSAPRGGPAWCEVIDGPWSRPVRSATSGGLGR